MGGFNTLISNLLAGVADPLTASLQATVTHYLFANKTVDDFNKPSWGAGTARQAIVAKTSKMVQRDGTNDAGNLVQASYVVTFPRPVPFDVRDRLVLPGSVEGPLLKVVGVIDPATNVVYATEVYLGAD